MPDVVELADDQPRLRLRQDIPVAIIIVPDVFVIKLRRRSSLERRAQRLAVPARHDIDAVGIERGRKQEDCVLQYRLEDRLEFARRRIDDLKNLGGSGLLFQGLLSLRD